MPAAPPTLAYETQPVGGRIVCERTESSITFTASPPSQIPGTVGLLILMAVITVTLGVPAGTELPIRLFLVAALWAGILYLVRSRLRAARTPLTLTWDGNRLVWVSARFGGGLLCEEFDRSAIRSIGVVGRYTSITFQRIGCLRVTLHTGVTHDVFADQRVSELNWVEREPGLMIKCQDALGTAR
jgi:hypothetical protein